MRGIDGGHFIDSVCCFIYIKIYIYVHKTKQLISLRLADGSCLYRSFFHSSFSANSSGGISSICIRRTLNLSTGYLFCGFIFL